MICQQIGLAVLGDVLQVRVVLDLVDRGRNFGRLQNWIEVFLDVVGHSDRLGTSGRANGFHLGPLRLQHLGVRGEEWRVDQVQIHVFQTQVPQRGGEVLLNGLVCFDGSLCCDKEILTRNAGGSDRSSQLLFVSVR